VGVRKQTGRGEGHSGLAFDRVVPTDFGGQSSTSGLFLSDNPPRK
jgi:hypothetical protein